VAIARFASDRFAFDAVTRRDFVVIAIAQTIPDRLGGSALSKRAGTAKRHQSKAFMPLLLLLRNLGVLTHVLSFWL
jgi:hypothetical protein